MVLVEMLLLSAIAFLVGIVATMAGFGGGVFIVPVLTLTPIFNLSSHQAFGTSLAMVIFTSLSSTIGYFRQGRADYKTGIILTITTVPGALLGAYLTSFLTSKVLGLIFGFFLAFVALSMTFISGFRKLQSPKIGRSWHRKLVDSEDRIFEYDANVGFGLVLSFFGGLFSGLFGIGAGSVIVSILHLGMSFPMHIAVATSMFIMVLTSIFGAVSHFLLGNVLLEYAVLLGLGTVFGAQFGVYLSKRTAEKNLRSLFGIVLFLASLGMILKYM